MCRYMRQYVLFAHVKLHNALLLMIFFAQFSLETMATDFTKKWALVIAAVSAFVLQQVSLGFGAKNTGWFASEWLVFLQTNPTLITTTTDPIILCLDLDERGWMNI